MWNVIPLRPGAQRQPSRRAVTSLDWYERGIALEREGAAAARDAYKRAIAAQGEFADAHNNLGRLCHEANELAAAEGHYRLALLCDDQALYWFNLGVVLADRGRLSEASAAYASAIAIEPTFAEAHFNQAKLLEARGDLDALRGALRHLHEYRKLVGRPRRQLDARHR